MKRIAFRRFNIKRARFGDGMGDGDEFQFERPQSEFAAGLVGYNRHIFIKATFDQFQFEKLCRKGCAVNFAFQLRPQMNDCADMIFMGMGDNKAIKLFTIFCDEAYIRHNYVDAGIALITKFYAQINHQPIAIV